MIEGGTRKVDQWTARHRLATVPFADRPVDPDKFQKWMGALLQLRGSDCPGVFLL